MSLVGSYENSEAGMKLNIQEANVSNGQMSGSMEIHYNGDLVYLQMEGRFRYTQGSLQPTGIAFHCLAADKDGRPIFTQGWSGYCKETTPDKLVLGGTACRVYPDKESVAKFDFENWERVQ